jgi:hypothetical protein
MTAEFEDKYERFFRKFNIDIKAIEEAAFSGGGGSLDPDLQQIADLAPTNDSVIQRKAGVWTYRSPAQLKVDLDITGESSGYALDGKIFCPEDYGSPVGDGIADDYAAVKAAWDAAWEWLLDEPTGEVGDKTPHSDANFYIPPGKYYRIDTSNVNRLLETDDAYAVLPIPMISRTVVGKKTLRIIGGGDHYKLRPAELAGTPHQIDPPCMLLFDSGNTTHTWSATKGLPSAIGATDADMTDNEGNTFSNVHISVEDITLRQNDNPSLCLLNLEQCSTANINNVRIDVETVLDEAPLCSNPTGASILMPRSNNNVAVSMDKVVIEGHYTGVPLTEHGSYGDMIVVRCTIGIANRRPNSHHSYIKMLKVEQCPYGLAGYNPAGDGVVTAFGWSGEITFLDFEDYDYNGEFDLLPSTYPHAHFWDENNTITALIKMNRVNSSSGSPNGVPPYGDSASAYVRGTANKIALWDRKMETAVSRLDNTPEGPAEDISLFEDTTGPVSDFDNSGTAICVAMEFRITAPGDLRGIRYWRATTAMPNNATGRVYKVTGQSAVSGTDVTFAAGSNTGWIEATFTNPVNITVDDRYVVVVRMPNGRYCATNSYWDSGDGSLGKTNGILRAENTNDTEMVGQGTFVEGAMAFPTGNGNGTNYWVDIIARPS